MVGARFLIEAQRAAEFRARQARIVANLAAFAASHAGSAAYQAEIEADWLPLLLARRDWDEAGAEDDDDDTDDEPDCEGPR